MRPAPRCFEEFFPAETIRPEALAEITQSPEFLRLSAESAAFWRAVGIDPGLPTVGRMRALAAVAGLAWEDAEKLIHNEPPREWFQSLRVRAAAAVRADQALPAAAAADVAGRLGGELVSACEIAKFAEIESRVVRRILESVKFEPGPVKRWRWDAARPVLQRWSENHRIARLRPLRWPENPSVMKNPAKNPGRIRR